jgi:hypothetical protein
MRVKPESVHRTDMLELMICAGGVVLAAPFIQEWMFRLGEGHGLPCPYDQWCAYVVLPNFVTFWSSRCAR